MVSALCCSFVNDSLAGVSLWDWVPEPKDTAEDTVGGRRKGGWDKRVFVGPLRHPLRGDGSNRLH